MSMNYYYYINAPCKTCGHKVPGIHIGKSSMGWCFSLHIDPYNGITGLSDWQSLFKKKGSFIEDEYGRRVGRNAMELIITKRKGVKCRSDRDLCDNYAVPGPFNLYRHRVDGVNCVSHGEGTWDNIIGDFS